MLTLKHPETLERENAVKAAETAEPVAAVDTSGAKQAALTRLIPGAAERPKFAVLDDWHEEGGFHYRPGVWHFGVKHGKGGDASPTLTKQWVCSPLHIDAVTTDAHAANYGRLLRIKTTLGQWKTWAMPMMMLRGDCSDLRGELLGMGVEIDPYGRNRLAEYLQEALNNFWQSRIVEVLRHLLQ